MRDSTRPRHSPRDGDIPTILIETCRGARLWRKDTSLIPSHSIFDRQLQVDDERDGCSIKGSKRQARSGSHEDVHPGSQADLHHPTLKQTSVTFLETLKESGTTRVHQETIPTCGKKVLVQDVWVGVEDECANKCAVTCSVLTSSLQGKSRQMMMQEIKKLLPMRVCLITTACCMTAQVVSTKCSS